MSHWHRAGLSLTPAEAKESSETLFGFAAVLSEEGNEPLAALLEEIATALKREQSIAVVYEREEADAEVA